MSRTTVEQLLQSGEPISIAEAFPILRKCAEMLDNVAERRELTPARISLDTTDSGSGAVVGLLQEETAALPNGTDQPLPAAGNAAYFSPEEIIGSPLDSRSTEFSFAVIAYEMLTGYKPFTGPDLSALVYQICAGFPPRANERNSKLNADVASVFDRALAKEPKQRFASCRAFVSALEQAAAERTAATARSVPELPAPPRRRLLLEDGPNPPPGAETSPSRIRRIGAIPTALIGVGAALLLVLLLDRHSMPSIPQQTADPRVGPVAPPPPPDENSDEDNTQAGDTRTPTTPRPVSPTPQISAPKAPLRQAAPAPHFQSPQLSGPGEGSVELLTEPPGGTIAVDGQAGKSCTAPCTLMLTPGRHVLSARLDGYALAQRIFNTPQDSSLIISLSPNLGTLIVASSPPGATVSVDGREAGRTPLTLHLRSGRHRLDVVLGNAYRQQFIDVQSDTIAGASFNLQ